MPDVQVAMETHSTASMEAHVAAFRAMNRLDRLCEAYVSIRVRTLVTLWRSLVESQPALPMLDGLREWYDAVVAMARREVPWARQVFPAGAESDAPDADRASVVATIVVRAIAGLNPSCDRYIRDTLSRSPVAQQAPDLLAAIGMLTTYRSAVAAATEGAAAAGEAVGQSLARLCDAYTDAERIGLRQQLGELRLAHHGSVAVARRRWWRWRCRCADAARGGVRQVCRTRFSRAPRRYSVPLRWPKRACSADFGWLRCSRRQAVQRIALPRWPTLWTRAW